MNIRLLLLGLLAAGICRAQRPELSLAEATRIETALAGDAMRGRRAGTPDADSAAAFIASEFGKAGLQPFEGNSFLQRFSLFSIKVESVVCTVDGRKLKAADVYYYTAQPVLDVDERSGYDTVTIRPGERLHRRVEQIVRTRRNTVVFVDPSFAKEFHKMEPARNENKETGYIPTGANTIFILTKGAPGAYHVEARSSFRKTAMSNVVGVLPGRGKECIVLGAHYDHAGVVRKGKRDSIYNGANDVTGTTAVILLAQYFRRLTNPNRPTIIFAAFTGEYLGRPGAQYLRDELNVDSIIAMINIKAIGTVGPWGPGAAYASDTSRSDLTQILNKGAGGSFRFYQNPYTIFFYSSGSGVFAMRGVPAHTISTVQLDKDKNYHTPGDEVSTLDLPAMMRVIDGIAHGLEPILDGWRPSRLDVVFP